ncbi:MAG TPA: hypothetical protein VES60_04980 [Nakamurella sp.]|nr:hypothetical protein [Nakamurella sp.]
MVAAAWARVEISNSWHAESFGESGRPGGDKFGCAVDLGGADRLGVIGVLGGVVESGCLFGSVERLTPPGAHRRRPMMLGDQVPVIPELVRENRLRGRG